MFAFLVMCPKLARTQILPATQNINNILKQHLVVQLGSHEHVLKGIPELAIIIFS